MFRTFILSFALLLALAPLRGQSFKVLVASYDTKVSADYFTYAGLEGVYHTKDHNEIHRYFIGGFDTRPEAEKVAAKAKAQGFAGASVIDMDEQKLLCAASCAPSFTFEEPELSVRNIFFDFDKATLRPASIQELDKLYTALTIYPSYRVQIQAHTDAKGSNEYNDALAQRRADAAQKYLLRKGLPAARIEMKAFGETAPIAINAYNTGSDSPEGRQYNRRVSFTIVDAQGQQVGIVEPIEVPSELKAN